MSSSALVADPYPLPSCPLQETIDERKSGRGKAGSEQQAVKNKLAELRGQFQSLVVRAGRGR